MIWSKALVEKFHGSPFCPPPPNFLEEHFEQKAESVVSFGGRVALLPPVDLHSEFQSVLLSGLRDRKIGKYSTLHDNAVFVYGYDHPETLRLAYMCVFYHARLIHISPVLVLQGWLLPRLPQTRARPSRKYFRT